MPEAVAAVAAVIEYVAADILNVAGNFVIGKHRRTVELADLRAVVR